MSVSGFYVVTVTGFQLTAYGSVLATLTRSFTNEQALPHAPFNSPHTIIDSGTTFTYVPSSAYMALRNVSRARCARVCDCARACAARRCRAGTAAAA